MHTIRTEHVQKTYHQGAGVIQVLAGITHTFESTKSSAITGVSGTGKSTFMHLLAGIDSPTAGTVFFDDQPLNTYTERQRELFRNKSIGLVFQESYLISELTVAQNVMLYGLISHQPRACAQARAQELLERIGLADKAHHHPKTLSGGQQQKVAVLRALFNEPYFILADEPTGSLDRESAHAILALLKEAHEHGTGLIVSSHDPEIAQAMDEHFVLNHGCLEKQD